MNQVKKLLKQEWSKDGWKEDTKNLGKKEKIKK